MSVGSNTVGISQPPLLTAPEMKLCVLSSFLGVCCICVRKRKSFKTIEVLKVYDFLSQTESQLKQEKL